MNKQPEIEGIHHLKLPVADLARSTEFYARALGAERIAAYDHVDVAGRLYAIILRIPNLGTLFELRLDSARAARHSGFDVMTLQVDTRADLATWIAWFDARAIPHSPVLAAFVAWLVVFEDPDGHRIRLYTREIHAPDIPPSQDARWL